MRAWVRRHHLGRRGAGIPLPGHVYERVVRRIRRRRGHGRRRHRAASRHDFLGLLSVRWRMEECTGRNQLPRLTGPAPVQPDEPLAAVLVVFQPQWEELVLLTRELPGARQVLPPAVDDPFPTDAQPQPVVCFGGYIDRPTDRRLDLPDPDARVIIDLI